MCKPRTPRTTASNPRTPTAAFPLRTASRAYTTWKKWPTGENLQSAPWSPSVSENQKKKRWVPCESLFIYLFFFGFFFEWQTLILAQTFNSYAFFYWQTIYMLESSLILYAAEVPLKFRLESSLIFQTRMYILVWNYLYILVWNCNCTSQIL